MTVLLDMTKPLKASGFLGLAVMMAVGLHQFVILSGGDAVPGWMIGGHAHLGVHAGYLNPWRWPDGDGSRRRLRTPTQYFIRAYR
jgi:hypothetical protein